jgi:signal transduction histidine kinase
VIRRLDRLPIRWRLAVTSAGLTLAILLLFALAFGALTTRQLRNDFDDDLARTADDLQQRLRVLPAVGGGLRLEADRDVVALAAAGDAALRVVYPTGEPLAATRGAPDLGPPDAGVQDVGDYRVTSRPVLAGPFERPIAFVQYAKQTSDLEASVARVRLFLALGVLGGSALALLAGLAVARRAMAPIAALTRAAKEIARTRDPAVRLPKPEADDEVADLARTLGEMLQALDAARAETEAMLERQREFVADASHELRTPLTSVLANLELLEEELAGRKEGTDAWTGDAAEIAESALRSSRRMRRLVADLLLLARADAGREAARRRTDVALVLAAAAAEAAPLADGHEVAIDAAPGLWVDAVPDDLHRLALNLLENALRHTPPGTPVRAAALRDADAIELTVEDEGPGIPAELRERLFDRFVRGGADGGGGGSGLGLAIVRAVAEAHGGSVRVEERPGGGVRFVVRLPAGTPPAPAPAEPSRAAG